MIEVPLQAGFVLYVLALLGLLVLATLYETLRNNTQHWSPSREELGYCDQCKCTFLIPRSEAAAPCPRCGKRVLAGNQSASP